MQGWFWACTQQMRDVATKLNRLSLVGSKPRNSPVDCTTQRNKTGAKGTEPMWVYGLHVCYTNNKRNRVQVVVTSDMLIYYHFMNTFNSLRPCGTIRWQRYGSSLVWVIIGSGNGLLPDSTKPLLVPVLTNYHWGFTGFSPGQPTRTR